MNAVKYDEGMIREFAGFVCSMTKGAEMASIEVERGGSVVERRSFSGKDPNEIAKFVIDQNRAGRNIFAHLGATLHKLEAAGARLPFCGSASFSPDGTTSIVGAPRIDPTLAKAPTEAPKPQSFLKMRGFA